MSSKKDIEHEKIVLATIRAKTELTDSKVQLLKVIFLKRNVIAFTIIILAIIDKDALLKYFEIVYNDIIVLTIVGLLCLVIIILIAVILKMRSNINKLKQRIAEYVKNTESKDKYNVSSGLDQNGYSKHDKD